MASAEYHRRWYARNREKRIATALAWAVRNPKKKAAINARYEASGHRPKADRGEYHRGWYELNRELVKEKQRAYIATGGRGQRHGAEFCQ